MADDRHYIGGDNYLLDDLSGFKIRRTHSRIIPGGQTGNLVVSPSRWEPQQPQDFVQGVRDDQTVPIARPRQQNQFVIVGSEVTQFHAAGGTALVVASVLGFRVGARCQVALDDGNIFYFNITSIAGLTLFFLGQPLPYTVGGSFADPLENAVIQLSLGTTVFDGLLLEGDESGYLLLEGDQSGILLLEGDQ